MKKTGTHDAFQIDQRNDKKNELILYRMQRHFCLNALLHIVYEARHFCIA